VLGRLTRAVLGRLAARTEVTWDDELLARIRGPLGLVWAIAIVYVLSPWLGLYAPGQEFLNRALHVGLFVAFFWSLLRAVDIAGQVVLQGAWIATHPGARSLIPIARRVAKVAVFGLAVVSVLSQLGFPVASLIAGLGIGGLALALAAQKTVENLFGAFTISMDQPFREGDAIRMGDKTGVVESIGLRSTRVRTAERTLVAIPNSHLAEMQVESLAARDRMILTMTVGLVYGTTGAQMRAVLAGLEQVLRAQPRLWPDTVVVRFKELAASSLDIEVLCWFDTPDFGEFRDIRQAVLLQFMDVVERAGTGFAFPTRTIHLVTPPP
ncbi:MAG TPA: mechanosensitive ion channel family protein, partial [Planctomycetota bacterium]|nr:mechanosensitive ion channel family protein [Planctomycetota bacterium]